MSAIGGIADLRKGEICCDRLLGMSLAMKMRGRKRSSAYIGKEVAFIYNSSKNNAFGEDEDSQPAIFERAGKEYALCIDSETHLSSAIFEGYRLDGIELLCRLGADFSLAIYDGERRIFVLARDREGKRPLYYKIVGGRIYFASEIRGILAALGECASIDREKLSLHLTSPMGVYRASDIYNGICEVMAGECIIFSRLGMSRFRYRNNVERPILRPRTERRRAIELYAPSNEKSIEDALADSLIAFEYPRFDLYMPSLCDMLSEADGRRIVYYDHTRRTSVAYSNERADRLGAFYGEECIGVMPREREYDTHSQEIFSYLHRRFRSLGASDFSLLSEILGNRKLSYLEKAFEKAEKKEDAEQELCTLGMLIQTVMWARENRLAICGRGNSGDQSALSTM